MTKAGNHHSQTKAYSDLLH